MDERHHESREDRKREDLVRDGDAGEGNDRHPDQIEDRDHHADRFRAQPVEPADANSRFCSRVSPARAGQQMPPVLLEDLEAAVGPTMALLLVGLESVGQEAMAVAPVGVMDLPAMLEHEQPEIGVLDDRVARPAAGEASAARRIRHIVP